jgi:hypothetical protein
VQGEHALLALGLTAAQARLDVRDDLRVERAEQPFGLGPRLGRRVAADHVQPDAEPQRPARLGGLLPDPGQLLGDLGRRLAPGQVDLDVPGRDRTGCLRRPPEVDVRDRVRQPVQFRVLDVDVLARQGEPLAAPQRADDGEELVGALVAFLLAEVVAVRALFVVLAAGHHVEQQPTS